MTKVLKFVVPMAVLFMAVLVTVVMVITRPKETRTEVASLPTLVQVRVVEIEEHTVVIPSTGVVEPAQQITLVPQVSGKVIRVARGLAPGLRLKQGELIAVIDRRDHAAAVEEAKAQVTAASLDLELEKRRGEAVEREFELLEQEPQDGVALREPHLLNAEQRVKAAEAALERAELNLARTALTAPFNAVVLSESVDVGQVIGGAPIATLAGTDHFLVRAAIPVDQLALIDLPAPSTVLHQGVEREATVVGSEGQLDPQARMAKLVVQVSSPLEGELPLLLGSFVELRIEGSTALGVELPRSALADGQVWLADGQDRLAGAEVTVGWSDDASVYITGGLEEGDRVVLTPLSYPVEGMPLELAPEPAR